MEDGSWKMTVWGRWLIAHLPPSVFLPQLGQDVVFLEDHVLVFVTAKDAAGDFLAAVLGVEDAVAGLDVDGDALAVIIDAAWADGDDLAHLGLLAGGVGDDEAAGADFFLLALLDDDAVAQRDELGAGLHGGLRSRLCGSLRSGLGLRLSLGSGSHSYRFL